MNHKSAIEIIKLLTRVGGEAKRPAPNAAEL